MIKSALQATVKQNAETANGESNAPNAHSKDKSFQSSVMNMNELVCILYAEVNEG